MTYFMYVFFARILVMYVLYLYILFYSNVNVRFIYAGLKKRVRFSASTAERSFFPMRSSELYFDFDYTSPIGLALNVIPFDAKSIGNTV